MLPSPPQYYSIGRRRAGLEDLVVLDCLVAPVAPPVLEDPVDMAQQVTLLNPKLCISLILDRGPPLTLDVRKLNVLTCL